MNGILPGAVQISSRKMSRPNKGANSLPTKIRTGFMDVFSLEKLWQFRSMIAKWKRINIFEINFMLKLQLNVVFC